MKKGCVICIGKLKTAFWKNAAKHYLDLLKQWRSLEIKEIKDSCANVKDRPQQEGKRIMESLEPYDLPVVLTENGREFSSRQFADFLKNCDENMHKRPAFILGGPYGHSSELLQFCPCHLSLSSMTWPHELARVMLLEQLYRAESILHNTPYHH